MMIQKIYNIWYKIQNTQDNILVLRVHTINNKFCSGLHLNLIDYSVH